MTAEHERVGKPAWYRWGPYLAERAWGTVREDYTTESPWESFPYNHARSRAYRWNEDGLLGISDMGQFLCLAPVFWNGRDPHLKDRLFGLTNAEGNHGEDVKEYYFFTDATPSHSLLEARYFYPQAEFPYERLREESAARGFDDFEYELADTGVFDEDRYWDITVTYAKAAPDDVLMRIGAVNRGPDPAGLWILPTAWFRNTWAWGYPAGPRGDTPTTPTMRAVEKNVIVAHHPALGRYLIELDGAEQLVFTDNETNHRLLFGADNRTPYTKDAFHRLVVEGDPDSVNPQGTGTRAAGIFQREVAPGERWEVTVRLVLEGAGEQHLDADGLIQRRREEADAFYAEVGRGLSPEAAAVQRSALAGMIWSKQFYYYDVEQWLDGDPAGPEPPSEHRHSRNRDWAHLNNFDVISMPDTWEYPWYAVWDLAFHCIPLAMIDPAFAKNQLELITQVWFQHPNGQLPAYEWGFNNANPPVHAWATWKVYQMDGGTDREFLARVFHKLLLNFTWWVNRKDADGNNVFQGGFLGLDNISIFDRGAVPGAGHIDQSDGTAWMGFYALGMMRIALELACDRPEYQDLATKFFEHFLSIAIALNDTSVHEALWNEHDGFFYDVLHAPEGDFEQLRVRSLVGLIPLIGVEVLDSDLLEQVPDFARRMAWLARHKPHLTEAMATVDVPGEGSKLLLSLVTRDRLVSLLRYLLDEDEFLSPHGIRSLSKVHADEPYTAHVGGSEFSIGYEPAESRTGLFGGNSNWRGPVWFPLNYLLIEALEEYDSYFGDDLRVRCPSPDGPPMRLAGVAAELGRRLTTLFLPDGRGRRPVYGGSERFHADPVWSEMLLFYEYFHGENGAGLGASHQTGWTGLVAELLTRYS